MGKPAKERLSMTSEQPQLGESTSSLSLHTTATADPPPTRYFDDEDDDTEGFPANGNDDLPPLYSDIEPNYDSQGVGPADPLLPSSFDGFKVPPYRSDFKSDVAYFIDPRLDSDPKALHDHIERLAHIPPRPFVKVRGTHRERRRREGKSESHTVVDFDIEMDLTHLLYADIHSRSAWSATRTVGNFEKVHRGTIKSARAPGFGGGGGLAEQGQPDVEEWCHRFCASHAGLKRFHMERRVTGWDTDVLQRRIEGLIRATNYRGSYQISFPIRGSRVEIYNDCATNRWRLTRWIVFMFSITLLFLFSWPWLYLRTKQWDTVYVEWQMSRPASRPGADGDAREYPSMSEERWYNTWARAMEKAILDRRQGILDQADLRNSLSHDGGSPRSGFAGVVQAGMEAMGVVNRSFGWGGDSV